MKSPIPDYLQEILEAVRPQDAGERAQYIPALANANPERLAAAFATVDGHIYAAGDADVEYTIQSISKPFVYALALADRGMDEVLSKVGVEPSGEAFNEISLDDKGHPRNPMINAGAITAHSLVGEPGFDAEERQERVLQGLSDFAGRQLYVDEEAMAGAMKHAHRNRAIAHMLRSYEVLTTSPEEAVEGYTRQCCTLVSTRDLAVMATTLVNGGINPLTGVRVVPSNVVRHVLSVMATCGMYDAAGDWFTQVGIPAKSGVAGGIIGGLPGQVGMATFSPRLDSHGNSTRGVHLFERFSTDMGLHLMEVPPPARSVIKRVSVLKEEPVFTRHIELQGTIRFAGAERVVRDIADKDFSEEKVVLDLTEVHSVDDVSQRMIGEVLRRLDLEGTHVYVVDPESVVPMPDEPHSIVVVSEWSEVVPHV